jgi:hypothetical protein
MRSTTQAVSSLYQANENRGGGGRCMAGGVGGSTMLYSAPKSNPFLPTRSRQRKEPILLTCDGVNRSWRVGGNNVIQPDINGGERSFRQCSGSMNHSSGNDEGGVSSSKR